MEKPWSRSSKSGSLRTMVSLMSDGFSGAVARDSRLETTSRAMAGTARGFLADAAGSPAPLAGAERRAAGQRGARGRLGRGPGRAGR